MSEITSITERFKKQAFVNETPENKRTGLQPKHSPLQKMEMQKDKVSLSGESKEMQIAKESVASSSYDAEVAKPERIEQLRQAIETGNYQINAEQIAEKMIGIYVDESV